jgi:protein tyrosine phosphatase
MLNIFKKVLTKEEELEHSHENLSFNYNKITENIYIGNNQCCHIMLDDLLKKEGIYADLSMEIDSVDSPIGVKAFLWLPVIDHTPPDMAQIHIGINFIEEIVRLNKKVYVHCKNGHGRAPTLVLAYMILKENKSFDQAYDIVKTARLVIHLDEIQEKFLRNLR